MLPLFTPWAEDRIRIRHNWFERLPAQLRAWRGATPPEDLQVWPERYPLLREWVDGAILALSPAQVLDLAEFSALPSTQRDIARNWVHQRFLVENAAFLADHAGAVEGLAGIDEAIRDILTGAANQAARQRVAEQLDRVAALLRRFPDFVEMPRSTPPSALPRLLILDDQLGRLDLARTLPLSERARRRLFQERQAFLHDFRLQESGGKEVAGAVGVATFSPVQRAESGCIVNDLSVALRALDQASWDLVVVDVSFSSGLVDDYGHGFEESEFGLEVLLPALRAHGLLTPVLVLSTRQEERIIAKVRRQGLDFLHRSTADHADLVTILVGHAQLAPHHVRAMLGVPDDFVAEDPAMIRTLLDAWVAAQRAEKGGILVLGPSGAGKERLAEFIHCAAGRSAGPILRVNCAQLMDETADAELFGYYQGAFTGADRDTPGFFQRAHGGTLVLDEFAELPESVQTKLLRVLDCPCEDREIQPRGQPRRSVRLQTQTDVLVVCSTNRDLGGRMRVELLNRLGTPIRVPSLAERPGDLAPLARHFLSHDLGAAGIRLASDAVEALANLPLTGSARELRSVLERAVRGKGRVNVLLGEDIEHAAEWVSRERAGETPAPLVVRSMEPEFRRISDPTQASEVSRWSGPASAAARVLDVGPEGWADLTAAEVARLRKELDGRVMEVVAILARWCIEDARDVPEAAHRLTGRTLRGRAPQDVVRRMMKLDDAVRRGMRGDITNERLRELCCSAVDSHEEPQLHKELPESGSSGTP